MDHIVKIKNLYTSTDLIEAGEAANGKQVTIAGLVADVRSLVTKKGDTMAILTIEDITGTISAVMFPRTWNEHRSKVQVDTVLIVYGKADTSRGDVQIIVDSVKQNFEVAEAAEPVPDFNSISFPWMTEEPTSGESTSSPYDEETGEYRREVAAPDPAPAAAEAVMPATAGASIPSAPPIEPPAIPHRASSEGRLLTEREMPSWLEDEVENGWSPKPDINYDDQGHIKEPDTNGNGSDDTAAFDAAGRTVPPKAPADRPQSSRKPDKKLDKPDEPEEAPLPPRPRRPLPKVPETPKEPGRLLILGIPRTDDSARDRRKMFRLHGFLTQYPGHDQFCFLIEGGGKNAPGSTIRTIRSTSTRISSSSRAICWARKMS